MGGFKDKTGLNGILSLDHIRNGQLIETIVIPNTIMNVGKSVISSFIGSDITTGVAFDHIAIGTSGIAAAATQTTLGSERVRITTTTTQETTTTTSDTARFIGSFGISGTYVIEEAGIFNAPVNKDHAPLLLTTEVAITALSAASVAFVVAVVASSFTSEAVEFISVLTAFI